MTNSIEDVTTNADLIVLVGSNPEEAHPVLGMQIRKAVERGCRLIVVDPRDIGLASMADIHLKLRPGTNVAFADGMCHVVCRDGLYDRAYIDARTEGFEEMRRAVEPYTPQAVAEICGIDADDLVAAAHMYASAPRAAILYCLGVTEHSTGTAGVFSLSNLAMMCGKIGKPGCGVNPVRGQNNVQGACDMGASPTDYTGYQKVADEAAVEKFEAAWGCSLPRTKGLRSTEVLPAAIKGQVKGLLIVGEDPVRTDPDTAHVVRALESLDFLVVEELFMTATARYADVVLPGRCFAEKEGTFTNTERRLQRVRKAVDGPGESRLDTDILADLMRRMGYPQPTLTSAQIMDEIASVTPSLGGVSHRRLDSPEVGGAGLQWPCPSPDHPGTPILHVGRFTRGTGKFMPQPYVPSAEQPCADYPLTLSTGRVLYQYNACAMTGRTPGLNEMGNRSFIEVNSSDARELGISDGQRVRVSSRRGTILSWAQVSDKTRPGQVWMPFHFQDGNANWLTNDALDSIAAVPEFKVCAVRVEPAGADEEDSCPPEGGQATELTPTTCAACV